MNGRLFRPVRNCRGMALMITILIISLLVVVSLEFSKKMRQYHLAASNLSDGERLTAMARSGLQLAGALLQQDRKNTAYDCLWDSWAQVQDSDIATMFPQGELQLQIRDLSGRLPINSIALSGDTGEEFRAVLLRLLLSGAFAIESEAAAQELVDCLKDWLDPDNEESPAGAEDSYYQSLSSPYACRNGAVSSLEELLLVKGITVQLLFGGDGKKALARYITVYGNNQKININTAPDQLLLALHPLMTATLVDSLLAFRELKEHQSALRTLAWYKSVPFWPGDVTFDSRLVSIESSYFGVDSVATQHGLQRRIATIVQRTAQGDVVELLRKVE